MSHDQENYIVEYTHAHIKISSIHVNSTYSSSQRLVQTYIATLNYTHSQANIFLWFTKKMKDTR